VFRALLLRYTASSSNDGMSVTGWTAKPAILQASVKPRMVSTTKTPLSLASPPTRYWIATDLDNLTTANNLRTTGCLFSMAANSFDLHPENTLKYLTGTFDYLPYIRNPTQEAMGFAPFAATVTRDYTVEVILETVRQKLDPLLPSRLSAVFAFSEKKLASRAAKSAERNLDWVYEFDLIDDPDTRVARANFQIVTLLRLALNAASWAPDQLEAIAEHYWRQRRDYALEVPSAWRPGSTRPIEVGTTWEYLIEGRLMRVGGPLAAFMPQGGEVVLKPPAS
jgi:hypothetical protein